MYELTTATCSTNYWLEPVALRKEVEGEILVTAQDVITAAILALHTKKVDLLSKCRKHELVRARYIIFYVMKLKVKILDKKSKLKEISLKQIGLYFGMDHTSVMVGINKIENDLTIAAYRQETNDQINSVTALL